MSISVGTLVSVIIFFLAVILLILTIIKRPAKSSNNSNDIGWDIVEEIKKNTEESVNQLKREKDEIDEKLKEIKKREERIEELYHLILKEGKQTESRISVKKSPMDDKKIEIYRLHNQGVSPEKISQMLKIHKGIVETVLNLQEHKRNIR